MISNDFERLKVWLALEERFSFDCYMKACAGAGCNDICTKVQFATKAGIATAAMCDYPDLSPEEAYMKYITIDAPPAPTGCGSCGGGAVR